MNALERLSEENQEIMHSESYAQILERIHAAIEASRPVFARFTPGAIETEYKVGHDPVTEADRALDAVLRKELLREGEGWLSEESVDDPIRLQRSRVWVVDPLDGTREFVKGIPEFCVSIGFVENGLPVAGGIGRLRRTDAIQLHRVRLHSIPPDEFAVEAYVVK